MRVVVDTNVLISAGMKADTAPRIAVRWIQRHGRFLKSTATEAELFRTIVRPKLSRFLVDGEFLAELKALVAGAELVDVAEPIQACADADDDKFLEVAVNGRAEMIISGDFDLLVLDPFRGIPIIDPAAFVRALIA